MLAQTNINVWQMQREYEWLRKQAYIVEIKMHTDKVDPAPPTVNSKEVALGKLLKKSQEKVTNNQNRRITKTPNSD